MAKTAGYISGLAAWLLALLPGLSVAQRIYFPSAAAEGTPVGGAAAPVLPSGVPAATAPAPTTTAPTFMTPPALPAGAGTAAPPAGASPVSPWTASPPAATFQGGIQTPPAWDPYGTPGRQAPSLFPQDPFFSAGPNSQLGIAVPAAAAAPRNPARGALVCQHQARQIRDERHRDVRHVRVSVLLQRANAALGDARFRDPSLGRPVEPGGPPASGLRRLLGRGLGTRSPPLGSARSSRRGSASTRISPKSSITAFGSRARGWRC